MCSNEHSARANRYHVNSRISWPRNCDFSDSRLGFLNKLSARWTSECGRCGWNLRAIKATLARWHYHGSIPWMLNIANLVSWCCWNNWGEALESRNTLETYTRNCGFDFAEYSKQRRGRLRWTCYTLSQVFTSSRVIKLDYKL